MKLNSVEWSDAQKLLLQLVDALSPLAEKPYFSPSIRLYIPPKIEENQSLQVRNPVRILLTLQKQVHNWAGIEKEGETVFQAGIKTNAAQRPMTSIEKQAKELITQVRSAIKGLASSSNLKNPEETPLRKAMKELQPHLDRLIQTVAEEGEEVLQRTKTPSFMTPSEREIKLKEALTKATRQPQIAKEILKLVASETARISEEKAPLIKDRSEKSLSAEQIEPSEEKLPLAQKILTKGTTANAQLPKEENLSQKERSAVTWETANLLPPSKPTPVVQGGLMIQTNDHEQVVSKPIQKPSIPLVPFVSETRSLTPARKKKKKKGFWRRGDEDEDRKDS